MDEKFRKDNPSPLNHANYFSQIFLTWIGPLLKIGYDKPLDEHDLYNTMPDQQSKHLTEELDREWQKELKTSKSPSLPRTLIRIHAKRFILFNMLMVLEVVIFCLLLK